MKHTFIKKLFSITMIATLACLSIFSPHLHPANAEDATTHNLTITNTTVDNKNLEAAYKIKAWKHSINEEVIPLGGFQYCAVNEEAGPLFYVITNFSYNNYSYSANEWVTNFPYYSSYIYDAPKYNEISSALKNTTYSLYSLNEEELLYETNMQIIYDNKSYTVYANFDYFDDSFDSYGDAEDFANQEYALYIIDRDESFNNYDLSSSLGEPDEEGYYTFALGKNDSKTIPIPEGYEFELKQILPDDSELVSINGSEEPIQLSGTIDSDITYTFLNRNLANDEEPEPEIPAPTDPTNPTNPTDPTNPGQDTPTTPGTKPTPEIDPTPSPASPEPKTKTEPTITVPNTGETTAPTSAAKIGIVAFTILATTTRVIYLIRRYKKRA